jgi:uncharacterized Zn-finger protein
MGGADLPLKTKCKVRKGENLMAQNQHKCAECGATFHSQADLERHYRTVHSRFTCDVCGETISSENEFETHNRITHPEIQKSNIR